MISLVKLFDRDNILCPGWLIYTEISDDWLDSVYSYEDGKHTWDLEDDSGNVRITYDGDEYNFFIIDDDDLVLLEKIIKDYEIRY